MKKFLLSLSLFGIMASAAFCLPKLLQRESFGVYDIENIDFNLSWENISIQNNNESTDILIEIYCNKEKFAPTITEAGSTIILKSSKKSSSAFETKNCTVLLKIPSDAQFETFEMGTTSGNIHSQTVINSTRLISSSTSGSQSFTEETFVQNAKFSSTSGSIFVEAAFGETLQVSATSGSINVQGFDGQSCSLDATSGSVKLRKASLDKLKIKTTSGSISLEGQVSQAFDVSATSGTIGLELESAPAANSRVFATSGSIFVGIPGSSSFSLMVQTTSGTFVNALTKEKVSGHVNYTRDINNGGATVVLTATSGRITVDSNDGVTAIVNTPSIDPEIPVVTFEDTIF